LKQNAQRYEFAFMKESGLSFSIEQHTGIIRALRTNDLAPAAHLLEENWQSGPRFLLPWLASREKAAAHATSA
jgi:DNA-binding GntR family transcriptional regulator